jgi:hypothetical protein
MSIAKQTHAFLEVSEVFLRQSGTGLFNDGLSSLEGVGSARGARTLMSGVLLNRGILANSGNGGGSGLGNDTILARVQDGA